MNTKIKDKNNLKNGSSINDHNLKEIKEECKVSENDLIDQYDEETVLLQIPQEDSDVGNIMKIICNSRTHEQEMKSHEGNRMRAKIRKARIENGSY